MPMKIHCVDLIYHMGEIIALDEIRKNQLRDMMVRYLLKELTDIIYMYMNSREVPHNNDIIQHKYTS